MPPQSFNETRGVAVTVLGTGSRQLTSMTLSGLDIGSATATVGARIYDNSSALLASAQVSVSMGSALQVSVPISAMLFAGQQYRLCFFVSAGGSSGAATMFDPAPSGVGGFPYTQTSGGLEIVQAYSESTDAFPTVQSNFMPVIAVDLCSPPSVIDMTSGTSGSLLSGENFNRTRGIDFTVNPLCGNLVVRSMTLRDLQITANMGTVHARIYDSVSSALLASAQTTVLGGSGLHVTLPISATLSVGGQYRSCFFVDGSSMLAWSTHFDPSPMGTGGFPYVDSTGALTINGAYSSSTSTDLFPTSPADYVCRMKLELGPETTGTGYCFGDGTSWACPCGNSGAAGNGCANSVTSSGGHLAATGQPSISGDSLTLVSTLVPDGPGLFFQGSGQTQIQNGDGHLCAGIGIVRLGVVFAAGNSSSYPGGTTPAPIHIAGATSAGQVRNYQVWFRDSHPTFCTSGFFNFTNGWTVLWLP